VLYVFGISKIYYKSFLLVNTPGQTFDDESAWMRRRAPQTLAAKIWGEGGIDLTIHPAGVGKHGFEKI